MTLFPRHDIPALLMTVLAGVAILSPAARAQTGTGTFRVDGATGVDDGACGSAVQPCQSIQQAVNLASSGDTIRVAQGTYTYDASLDTLCTLFIGQTGVVCILNKELTILGGFAGGNWTTPDPASNPTTIDGEDAFRGILILRTAPGEPAASLVMEGFTVTRGLAQGASSGPDIETFAFGGGLSATLTADVTLRDMTFSDNRSLGGSTSAAHGGSGSGGAVSIRGNSATQIPASLERVTFTGNVAQGGTGPDRGGLALGGGLFTTYVDVSGEDLTFTGNQAIGGDSAGSGESDNLLADAQGGGAVFQIGSVAVIQGLAASGNSALGGDALTDAGGAFGGNLFAERAAVTLTDADLRSGEARGGNAANGGIGAGGALTTTRTDLTLDRAVLVDNQAIGGDGPTKKGSAGGGGAYLSRPDGATTLSITNAVISDNAVELGAGGGAVGGGGGGIFLIGGDLDLAHATLAGNRLGSSPLQGQAMVLVTAPPAPPSVADVDYCVIADHTEYDGNVAALHVQDSSTANLNNGLWAGNDTDSSADLVPPVGTINGLATMLSAASADFVSPGAPDFDYHILVGSPAIDQASGSGTPLDFEAQTRVDPDVGADELGAPPFFADGFESGDTNAWSAAVP